MNFISLHDSKITAKRYDTLWHFVIQNVSWEAHWIQRKVNATLLFADFNRHSIASSLSTFFKSFIAISIHKRYIVYFVCYSTMVLRSLLEVISYQIRSTFTHSFIPWAYLVDSFSSNQFLWWHFNCNHIKLDQPVIIRKMYECICI